jgi:hypothetical protein
MYALVIAYGRMDERMKKILLSLLVLILFMPTPYPIFASISSEEIQFIGKGLSPDVLRYPSYLASDQHRLLVVDETLHQIALFSSSLDRIGTFGSFGQSEGEFDGLGRVRIVQNNMFVLDRNNQRIQVFDFRWRFVRQFSLIQKEDPEAHPNDFVIIDQTVYVSLKNRSYLATYQLDGQFEKHSLFEIDEIADNVSLFADSRSLYLWNETASTVFQYDHGLSLIQKFSFPGLDQNNTDEIKFDLCSFEQKLYFLDKLQGKVLAYDIQKPESPLETWESKLPYPSFMTINQGKLVISSQFQGTLSQFNLEGKVLKTVSRTEDLSDFWIRPGKIVRDLATSSMLVLDTGAMMIKKLDNEGKTEKIFALDKILPLSCSIQSFALIDNHFALLNTTENKVYIVNQNTELIRTLGPLIGGKVLLSHAQDIASDDHFLYLADSASGRIIKTDIEGSFALDLISHTSAMCKLRYPSALDVNEDMIVVMDTHQNAFFWYDKEGQCLGSAGKHGNEPGSFMSRVRPQWIAPGRILLTDTDNHRVQLFDIWTGTFKVYGYFGSIARLALASSAKPQDRYQMKQGMLFYPSSANITENGIWISDTLNSRIQLIPFDSWGSDFIESIPSRIDLSFEQGQSMVKKTLFLWSEAPLMVSGELQSTNPGIEIAPSSFQQLPQWVTLTFHRDKLKGHGKKEDRIILKTDELNGRSIPVVLDWEDSPDYIVLAPPLLSIEAGQSFRIPFSILPINDFEENISFTLRGTPSNAIPSIEPSFYRHGEPFNGNIVISLNPNKRWEHGRYEMVLESKSLKSNQLKQTIINLFINHSPFSAPRRVLSELFSGIWCTQCIYYHYVFKKLDDEIGNVEANFIQYYVFSTVDQPKPRLAFEKSNARIRFYQHDQGLPSLYFDGVDSFKGVPYDDREAAVENICRSRVENRKKDPAPLSITAHSVHDSAKNQGLLRVHMKVLDDMQNVKEPRLYAALVESNINYTASSGKSEHHLIFRDFLPLDPSKPEQMGIPLRDSGIGFTGKIGEEIDLVIPYAYLDIFFSENLHLVVFVQDQALKKIYQSFRLPLSTVQEHRFDLRSSTDPLQKVLAGTSIAHQFYVYNPSIYPMKLTAKYSSEFSTEEAVEFDLAPFSEASFPVSIMVPETYLPGTEISYVFEVESKTFSLKKALQGRYQIMEDLDPDFEIKLEHAGDITVLSGESLQVGVQVLAAPYFEDTVELILEGETDVLQEYSFEKTLGSLPLDTVLTMKVRNEAFKDNVRFTVRAIGGELQRTADFVLNIKKNPAYFPPELILFEPEENLLSNQKELLIRGKTDPESTLTINGDAVSLQKDASFEILYHLVEGINEIKLKAVNAKGLSSQLMLTVTLDTQAPEITWINLPEVTHSKEFILKGKTDPENLVFFIDEVVVVDGEGYFEVPLDLIRGINYLEFLVIDPAKNETLYLLEIRQIILIRLMIGKAVIEINEEERPLPAAPYIKNSRTMVPLRALSEAFGFQVEWVAEKQEIILTLDQKRIHFYIGKTQVLLNEEVLTIDAAPEIVNSSTFVPLRVVSEIMGARIEWNAAEQSIRIEY